MEFDRVTVDYCRHSIPPWAVEEMCRQCRQKATHKVEETSGPTGFHPLTAYLCCGCFMAIVGYDCSTYPYDVDSARAWAQQQAIDAVAPKPELGGAVGRRASFACAQGQHDLCDGDAACLCRCHE